MKFPILFLVLLLTACQSGPSTEQTRAELLGANLCQPMGAIDEVKVKQALKNLTVEFKKCYAVKMAQKKNVNGRVCLSWDITKSGAVEKVQLISVEKNKDQNDDRDGALLQCLQDKMRAAKFPMPACRTEPCLVRYPVNFVND